MINYNLYKYIYQINIKSTFILILFSFLLVYWNEKYVITFGRQQEISFYHFHYYNENNYILMKKYNDLYYFHYSLSIYAYHYLVGHHELVKKHLI